MAGKGRTKGIKVPHQRKHGVAQAVEADIMDAIANNISLDDLHKSNPDKYPAPIQIYRKMHNNEAFRNKIIEARKVLANVLVEKLHSLRANPPNPSDYEEPLINKGNLVLDYTTNKPYMILSETKYKHAFNIWTKQLKSVHDELHQLGSIFNNQFTKTQKIDSNETHTQQVIIQDYKEVKITLDNTNKSSISQSNTNLDTSNTVDDDTIKNKPSDVITLLQSNQVDIPSLTNDLLSIKDNVELGNDSTNNDFDIVTNNQQ